MASVTQLVIDGVSYDVEDAALRAEVAAADLDNRLKEVEADLDSSMEAMRSSIEAKGGTIEGDAPLTDYAKAIDSIPEVDWSEVTATSSDIREGSQVLTESGVVQGTLVTRTEDSITVADNVVSVPSGIYDSSEQLTVGNALADTSIKPGASDQLIGAGTYIVKDLTIEGDANLLPENIVEGATIFGVAGSHICAGVDGGNEVEYGYIDADGKFQGLDLYGESPVNVGDPFDVDLKMFLTGQPLPEVGKVDLSFITASAGDILSGKVGSDTEGNPVNGTIPSKATETFTPGTIDQTIVAGTYLSGDQTIKGDANLIAANIAEGKKIFGITGTFKGSSQPATGGMDFYKCAAVYGPRKVTCFVISGCPTPAVNGTYIQTEFTTEDWEGIKQPVYSNGTYYYYYNSTDMIWCISGDYNSYNWMYYGEGSYWSDSNWDGVPDMTGVKSTAMVDTDVPKTWDGHKAVLSGGVYSFESEATTGLTYSDNQPQLFKIYSADMSVQADWLDDGTIYSKDLVLHVPMTDRLDMADTGQRLKNTGAQLTDFNGVKCAKFDNYSRIELLDRTGLPLGSDQPLTVFMNAYINSEPRRGYYFLYFTNVAEIGNTYSPFALRCRIGDRNLLQDSSGDSWAIGKWTTIAVTKTADEKPIFTVMLGKNIVGANQLDSCTLTPNMNTHIGSHPNHNTIDGYLKDLRIYNRAFSYDEVCEYVDRFGFDPDTRPIYSDQRMLMHFNMNDTGTAAVDDVSGISLTANGSMTAGAASIDGASWEATSNGSYLRGDNNVFGQPQRFTLNMWVKLTDQNTSTQHYLIDFGGYDYYEGWGINCNNGKLGFRVGQKFSSYSTDISFNEWHAVCCTWDGTKLRMYLDGVNTQEFTPPHMIAYHKLVTMFMRGDKTNEGQLYGKIDEVSLWNYVMSDSEISGLYQQLADKEESTPGDSGSGDGKTYVYTVSGAGTTAANGDYWLTDQVYDDGETTYPIYTNGTYYMYCSGSLWFIDQDTDDSGMNDLYWANGNKDTGAAGLEWKSSENGFDELPAPTVTAYQGGGSTGDGGASVLASAYQVSGAGGDSGFNDIYRESDPIGDRSSFWTEYGFCLNYSPAVSRWELRDPGGSTIYYCETDGTPTDGEWKALSTQDAPAPTVTAQ